MNKRREYASLSDRQLELVSVFCESFERAIRDGIPSLESQLEAAPAELRDFLFRELLTVELECRVARGETPGTEEYESRFAERHREIQDVFDDLVQRTSSGAAPVADTFDDTITLNAGGDTPMESAGRPSVSRDDSLGSFVGPYQLIEQIGSGGMGAVYLAEQTKPVARQVALKLIKAGMDSEQVIARFEAERQALALMEHDNIARVLDAGTSNTGRPYFVMELVRGSPITDDCDQNQLLLHEKLRLFVTVCRAVQHAHQKGIIHRDIKPSNVLVSRSDGHPVPKVIDFGVAKAAGPTHSDRTMFTQLGQVVGTVEYMSPEQADLNELDIDTRSDVFSLGVLLYQLLTGTTPISRRELREVEFTEMLRMIRESEPSKPSTRISETGHGPDDKTPLAATGYVALSRMLQGDLDWIVMRAIEKERSRRYESASALADDIERYLNDQPVEASPPSVGYRFGKFARRNKTLLLATVSVSAILIVSTVFSAVWALRAVDAERRVSEQLRVTETARDSAKAAQQRETEQRRTAEEALYFSRIALAQQDWQAGDVARAVEHLDRCLPISGERDLRDWEWHYLHRLCHPELTRIQNQGKWIYSVGISANGNTIASGAGLAGVEEDPDRAPGELKLWDIRSGELLQDLSGTLLGIRSVAFCPDGRRLVTGGGDVKNQRSPGEVRIWDRTSGEPLLDLPGHMAMVYAVAVSPDGTLIASGSGVEDTGGEAHRGELRIHDAATGATLHQRYPHAHAVRGLAFSPDGKQLASIGADANIVVSDAKSGKPLHQLRSDHAAMNAISYGLGGDLLASAGSEGYVGIWQAREGELVRRLQHNGAVWDVEFSPDGRRLATAGADKTVRIWDVASGQELRRYRGHTRGVRSVVFTPSGSRLVSCGEDGSIRVWDLAADPRARKPYRISKNYYIRALAFGPHERLHAALLGGRLQSWDANTGVLRSDQSTSAGRVFRIFHDTQFTADCATVLAPDWWVRSAHVWDTETGASRWELGDRESIVTSMCLSADGKVVATTSMPDIRSDAKNVIRIWDATSGREIRSFEVEPGRHRGMAMTPNGEKFVLAMADSAVRVYDTRRGVELLELVGHHGFVAAVTFSHDGQYIASAGFDDEKVRVWDASSGKQIREIEAIPTLTHLAFSPNGNRLAAVGFHSIVRIWSTSNWQDVFSLTSLAPQRPADFAYNARVAFSRDGTAIAATNWDGSINVWDAKPFDEQSAADRSEDQWDPAVLFVWHLGEAKACLESGIGHALRFHLLRLLGVEPPNNALRADRARLLAQLGLFERAGIDASAAVKELQNDIDLWQLHACLQILNGDDAGYAVTRTQVLDRFENSRSPLFAMQAVRIGALGVHEGDGYETDFDREAEGDPRGLKFAAAGSAGPDGLHVLGLNYHRAGHFERAIESLQEGLTTSPNWKGNVMNWLVLALSQHKLGRTAEAKNRLTQAEKWIQNESRAYEMPTAWLTDTSQPIPNGPVQALPLGVSDWLAAIVLLRETQAVVSEPAGIK